MPPLQLPNYLVSNRKRLALSQEEVAFLIGVGNGQQVCRHERFAREPSLEMVFAYEAIYRRTGSELFAGHFRKVEQQVAGRAKILVERTGCSGSNPKDIHKCRMLSDLAGLDFDNLNLE